MTARKYRRSKKKSKNNLKLKIMFLLLIIFVIPIILLSIRKGYWNGNDKLSLVIREKSGDITISTFDPGMEEIVNLKIPANTQVNVARDLGIWKLNALWKLSENENLTGNLLTETITKHFTFPVYVWADYPAIGFSDTNPINVFKAAILPYKTNLGLHDRIKIAVFASRVKNPKRIDIDLSKTSTLKETNFIDGTQGYTLSTNPSYKIFSIFSDTIISKEGSIVAINDNSEREGLAEKVGEIIEVFGAKVASIRKKQNGSVDQDCLVKGTNEIIITKISRVFSCETEIGEVGESFDVEVTINKEFSKRY